MSKKPDYKKMWEDQLKYARKLVNKLNQYEGAIKQIESIAHEALTTKPKTKEHRGGVRDQYDKRLSPYDAGLGRLSK